MSKELLPSNRMTDDRLRNTRAWAAARPDMSGSGVIVGAIDELLQLREWHANGRSNVEYSDDTVRVCRGLHEKHDPCEWIEYRRAVETNGFRHVPTAWVRGVKDADTPDGPGEWNADFVYGDDQPEGDGWVPLFSRPPHIRPAEETADDPAEPMLLSEAMELLRQTTFDAGAISAMEWERRYAALRKLCEHLKGLPENGPGEPTT